jgi:deazaflavin-dependent oxidoreductase (nitroreductase family)
VRSTPGCGRALSFRCSRAVVTSAPHHRVSISIDIEPFDVYHSAGRARTGADETEESRMSTSDRPSLPQRVANRMLRRMVARGKGPSFMRLLTVTGRRTGQRRITPIVPVERDGQVWLISAFGDVAWARNVRANGRLERARGDARTRYEARELDAGEAVPVLRTYLSMPSARFVRRHFDVTPDSSDEAFAAEAPRHPTFALTPVP